MAKKKKTKKIVIEDSDCSELSCVEQKQRRLQRSNPQRITSQPLENLEKLLAKINQIHLQCAVSVAKFRSFKSKIYRKYRKTFLKIDWTFVGVSFLFLFITGWYVYNFLMHSLDGQEIIMDMMGEKTTDIEYIMTNETYTNAKNQPVTFQILAQQPYGTLAREIYRTTERRKLQNDKYAILFTPNQRKSLSEMKSNKWFEVFEKQGYKVIAIKIFTSTGFEIDGVPQQETLKFFQFIFKDFLNIEDFLQDAIILTHHKMTCLVFKYLIFLKDVEFYPKKVITINSDKCDNMMENVNQLKQTVTVWCDSLGEDRFHIKNLQYFKYVDLSEQLPEDAMIRNWQFYAPEMFRELLEFIMNDQEDEIALVAPAKPTKAVKVEKGNSTDTENADLTPIDDPQPIDDLEPIEDSSSEVSEPISDQ